jgi:hypothetical protein
MLKTKIQLTAAQILDNQVTEKELKHNVETAFKTLAWDYYHTFFSEYSPGGFPDEFAWRANRNVFMELKTMRGKLSEKQIKILDSLSDNPANECFVVRPNQMQLVIDVLGQPDPYQGPERWARENHYGANEKKEG